jgi:hypothetical protein
MQARAKDMLLCDGCEKLSTVAASLLVASLFASNSRCSCTQARAKDMLLCDGCDRGYHLHCLEPPLAAAPLAAWYCPACLGDQTCETCGQAVAGKHGRQKRQAKDLTYCATCGGLCHAGCMQAGGRFWADGSVWLFAVSMHADQFA